MVLDDDQTTVAEAREGRGRVPDEPDALLTRAQTAEALTACGFPTTKATPATKAVRGGGPKFSKWGNKPLYRWRDAMAWATARLAPLSKARPNCTLTAPTFRRAPSSLPLPTSKLT
jgi:hypothetical protein